MATDIVQLRAMREFRCIGASCEDNCCTQNWTITIDPATYARWEERAPELRESAFSHEQHGKVLRHDPCGQRCIKFEEGMCAIHRDYGEEMLGDTCFSYPRITRSVGGLGFMSGALSCPEMARILLFGEAPFAIEQASYVRVVFNNGLSHAPLALSAKSALTVMKMLLDMAGHADMQPEMSLARLCMLARMLEPLPMELWEQAVPIQLQQVAGRMPSPVAGPQDPFLLLVVLCVLARSTGLGLPARLEKALRQAQHVLGCTLEWDQASIDVPPPAYEAYRHVSRHWFDTAQQAHYAPVMRRYLQTQIAIGMFPYAGLGESPIQRAVIMGVKFAAIRLMLMCAAFEKQEALARQEMVDIIQPVSRLLDHLSDCRDSWKMVEEVQWHTPERFAGLARG